MTIKQYYQHKNRKFGYTQRKITSDININQRLPIDYVELYYNHLINM